MKIKIQYILSALALSLTLSYGAFAQTTTQSQKFGTNPTNIAPSAVLEIESTNKGVLFPRVTLTSTSDVTTIASPATGLTVFNTASAGTSPSNVTPGYYYWNGSKWVKMAIETPFAKTVYVNATSPTTATIFDENNPPATNDNALKADDVNLYIGNNGSTWTYNTSTSTYNTFIVPASTPFNLAGTTTDAGNNKTGAIDRAGSVSVTNGFLRASGSSNSFTMDPTQGGGPRLMLGPTATPNGFFELGAYNSINNFDTKARDFNIFSTARANALYLKHNTGNIGFGTNNPTASLDVISSVGATATVNADVPMLKLTRPTFNGKWGGVAQFSLGSYGTGAVAQTRLDMGLNNGGDLTTINPVMTLQGDGNVGIGTTAPLHRLDINNGSILVRRGNTSTASTYDQILFGYLSTNSWQHTIKTRHNNGGIQGNAIDFYVWSQTTNGSNTAEVGKQHVMSLDGAARVGIGGIVNPSSAIDAQSPTVATATVNASRKMLRLSIPTAEGTKTGNVAEFNMGSYATGGPASTRLDLALNNGSDNTVSQVMTWQANGNVGIGTTAPSQRLHIKGNNAQPATTGTVSNAIVRIDGSSSHALDIGTFTNVPYGSYLQSVTTSDLTTKLPLVLNPTGGNVGIGINNPANTLSVLGNARIQPNSSNNGTGDLVWFEMYGKTSATPDTQVGGIKLGWYDLFGGIEIVRPSSSIGGLGLAFNYANSSGTTTEGFRLNNSGNVGIGTTAPTQRLQVAGNIAASGTVSASGTTLTSDARLKSNIVNLNQGLSKIMQLNPVNYDKKEALDSAATINENGFIAQELQKIMPELVTEGNDEDKLLSINYTAIIPVLTKAVQEQQAIIEKQQMQINELKALLEKVLKDK